MRICIDSNQFIFGIEGTDPASETLITLLPYLEVVIPRLILIEVTRNLKDTQVKALYSLLKNRPNIKIIENTVPVELVNKYVELGLREKADAFIGAFAEWQKVNLLISDNRHFLDDLTEAPFEVLSPDVFIRRYYYAILREEIK